MSELEYAIIATAFISGGIGILLGFAAGRARIREAVLARTRRRARYRRVGSSK